VGRKGILDISGEARRKTQIGGPRRMRVELGEIGWGGRDWIDLSQDRDHWRDNMIMVINFLLLL
jgi:hypothetical protein